MPPSLKWMDSWASRCQTLLTPSPQAKKVEKRAKSVLFGGESIPLCTSSSARQIRPLPDRRHPAAHGLGYGCSTAQRPLPSHCPSSPLLLRPYDRATLVAHQHGLSMARHTFKWRTARITCLSPEVGAIPIPGLGGPRSFSPRNPDPLRNPSRTAPKDGDRGHW